MEYRELWLTCQKGSKTYLLAKDEKAYYIIDVDRHLNYDTEEWLIQQGISEALLKELALSYERIAKEEVRGVAIGGCEAGESVYMYLKSGKRQQHMLTLDSDEKWMDQFFGNIPRFTPPVDKKQKKDGDSWRREGRDPDLMKKLRFVSPVLTLAVIGCSFGYAKTEDWRWFVLCMLCVALPLVLDILLPAYFTLIPAGKGKKRDAWELEWPIFAYIFIMCIQPGGNWLNEGISWAVIGIGAVGFVVILGLLAEEFRREKLALAGVALFGGLLALFLAGHANEALDFSTPEVYSLVVEELDHSSSRRNRRYECTVTLPDGRQVELDISNALYQTLEVGDRVMVEHSVGALGIEYVNAYSVEER
ncbi:MAG: hypothetical protein IJ422_03135 [Oscillospiraceae bacterium]|nr:hypothetical protein [Oscillospiraceae bacterium]MBQ9149122.1 hypothetical protein [Oscillospiraceae bacterium]